LFDLSSHVRRVQSRIKCRDVVDPRLPRDESLPKGILPDAVGGHDTESGDDYAMGFSHDFPSLTTREMQARREIPYHKCGKILRDCSSGHLAYNRFQSWRTTFRAGPFWPPPCRWRCSRGGWLPPLPQASRWTSPWTWAFSSTSSRSSSRECS